MSTSYETERADWPMAAVAGVAAGLVRPAGVAVLAAVGVGVGALELTLQHDLPFWWLIHLSYSLAFGALYGVVVSWDRLRTAASTPATGVAVGAAYGIVLWVANVLVLWSLLTAVVPVMATDASAVGPLVGHVVYGALLGTLYPLLVRGRG